jgi:uncharacterized protein with HEPN domain
MSTREPSAFLLDMHSSASFVRGYSAGRTEEQFLEDRGFRSAVERELMIIGEALYQLNRFRPDLASRITDSRRIIDFRHLVVHGYYKVDPQRVWSIVQSCLDTLVWESEVMLRESGIDPATGERRL